MLTSVGARSRACFLLNFTNFHGAWKVKESLVKKNKHSSNTCKTESSFLRLKCFGDAEESRSHEYVLLLSKLTLGKHEFLRSMWVCQQAIGH